ncbi:MAG: Ribosomal protein L5 [Parcubacteria group bacterium GW2011_GWF2_38_76]|nr:MAG: Ribosomal protein L5 [Parcubacteria group bacterium GW2011_GWF2_38_76]
MQQRDIKQMDSIKQNYIKNIGAIKDKLGIKNIMAVPKITKVVVSVGTGSFKDKKKNDVVVDRIAKITGQKSVSKGAKKSVASFKIREGDLVGHMITLRGDRMYGFLNKLINVAIPRTRDFRGLDPKAVDNMGNFTMAVKENTVFPETSDEDLRDVFGMGITIVTTAKNKKDATEFLRMIGFPFKK